MLRNAAIWGSFGTGPLLPKFPQLDRLRKPQKLCRGLWTLVLCIAFKKEQCIEKKGILAENKGILAENKVMKFWAKWLQQIEQPPNFCRPTIPLPSPSFFVGILSMVQTVHTDHSTESSSCGKSPFLQRMALTTQETLTSVDQSIHVIRLNHRKRKH